jgi:WD40 repeat protein
MPGEKDEKNKSIVSSGQQSITKYSSSLIRRGLDSIARIEQKDRGVIPYRRKITPENARLVRQIGQLNVGYEVDNIKFSPDGKLLAVALRTRVYLYDANKLEMVRLFEDDDSYLFEDNELLHLLHRGIAFSPDGIVLATTGFNSIRLWRVSDGSLLREIGIEFGFSGTIFFGKGSIAFSPDGTVLASSVRTVNDATVNVYDATVFDVEDFGGPFEIRFYRVSDGLIILDRVTDNIRTKCVKTFPGFEKSSSSVSNIAFSPDGTILAFSPYGLGPDCGVWLWSFPDGCFLRKLKGRSQGGIGHIAFSPNGNILAGAQHNYPSDSLCLWRVSDGFLLHDINPAEGLLVDDVDVLSTFYNDL